MGLQEQKRCLFVQYTAQPSGSPISGLSIIDALADQEFEVDVVFGISGSMEKEYASKGCAIHHLHHGHWLLGGDPLHRLWWWLLEIRSAWAFSRLFRVVRPDIVYVNTTVSIAPVLAASLRGLPVIWHIRELFSDVGGEMHWPFGGPLVARMLLRSLPRRLVFVSETARANVLGSRPCRKSEVIPNPLARAFFERQVSLSDARRHFDLPADGFLVGLPGTLRPVKGHDFFLAAASLLVQGDRTYHFMICGDFDHEYGHHIRDMCVQLGIRENVHFVGSVDDMCFFYGACDVACIPSRSESFGRTVIEAFAQRRPVVATRAGGIVESVSDGQTGLLVDYGDAAALAKAIRRLRQDPALRASLTERAWRLANDRYGELLFRCRVGRVVEDACGEAH